MKLKNAMISRGFNKPQYIGCQHIIDKKLKHVLDFFNPTSSIKPTLNYKFVDDDMTMLHSYKPKTELEIIENPRCRDNFRFLFELCRTFCFFKGNGFFLKKKA